METKKVEELFGSETRKYDRKHINNVSTKQISESIVEDIEKNGITSEMLDNLDLPVFRYGTQITIHGIFPENCDVRVGGYRNLVKNKNESLGVRYNAIDRAKKKRLFDAVCFVEKGWHVEDNSTLYGLSYIVQVKTKEEYAELKEKAEKITSGLKNRVYAVVNAFIAQDIFGRLFGVISVNILAIYETDIVKAFHSICPDYERTLADAELELAEFRKAEKIRRDKEMAEFRERCAIERKEREAKKEASRIKVTQLTDEFAKQHGFVKCDRFDCRGRKVYAIFVKFGEYSGEYKTYIKLVEGKNAIRLETKLNDKFEKSCSWESAKRMQGTELVDVWVKPV